MISERSLRAFDLAQIIDLHGEPFPKDALSSLCTIQTVTLTGGLGLQGTTCMAHFQMVCPHHSCNTAIWQAMPSQVASCA